jgi:type II restriction/modification system DNA methylase subunit YeeA
VRAVRYHPEARAEFLEQLDHFIDINVRLATRFDSAVTEAEELAAESPESWPKYKYRTRRVIDRVFKFSLVYLHSDQEIYVVAVAPTRRKPGYWRKRVAPR